jgi:hypothetical protein
MQKFKDQKCFERFIKAQVDEIRYYRTLQERISPHIKHDLVAVWVTECARKFRDDYTTRHPEDFID